MITERKIPEGGELTIDPTENVKALQEASNKRQDDLRDDLKEYVVVRLEAAEKISQLRADHQKEIRAAESARIDSIRQVDVTAARTAEERQLTAIQVLATQAAANAENLRNTVNSTAATIAKQTSDTIGQLIERIAALEKSSYEGKGKSAYADPVMEKLLEKMEAIRGTKSEGISSTVAVIISVIGAAGVIAAIVFGVMALK